MAGQGYNVMSLIQRVERAQQQLAEAEPRPRPPQAGGRTGRASASPPVAIPVSSEQRAAREELLHEVRLRLQDEVMSAFDTLLDLDDPAELRAKVDGDRRTRRHARTGSR